MSPLMLSERRRLDGFAQMRGRSGRVISRLATLQPKAAANVEIPSPLAGRVRKLGAAVGQMLGAMGSGLASCPHPLSRSNQPADPRHRQAQSPRQCWHRDAALTIGQAQRLVAVAALGQTVLIRFG